MENINKIKLFITKTFMTFYLICNLLYLLIGTYLVVIKKFKFTDFAKSYRILLALNIVMIIIMLIYNKIKKKRFGFNKSDIFLLLMIIFAGIATIFAENVDVSINGFKGRYEGLIQLLYYYTLYFIASFRSVKSKKIIIFCIFGVALINLGYAILEVTGIGNVVTRYLHGNPWATGFISNPNFFGTFMLINLSYAIGLFIDSKNKLLDALYILLIALFNIGLLISDTMSCVVGLGAVCLYLLIHIIKKRKFIKLLIIVAVFVLTSILTVSVGKTAIYEDFVKYFNQTKQITQGNVDEKFGSNRVFIWKNTIKIIPDHLINGAGIDNFFYAFDEKPLQKGIFFYDKAHNEYLQTLVCEGIFALISYLIFYGIIVITGIKNGIKNKEVYLVLPVIGYIVQAFFNISVIEVAPYFFIALGFLTNRKINNN